MEYYKRSSELKKSLDKIEFLSYTVIDIKNKCEKSIIVFNYTTFICFMQDIISAHGTAALLNLKYFFRIPGENTRRRRAVP